MPALMTVLRNSNRWGPSNAVYHRGMVTLYDKGAPALATKMSWTDYGLLVLTATAVKRRIAPAAVADLATALRGLSLADELAGFPVTRRFYEVGSPDGVRQLESHLRKRQASSQV
jgi:hypothetical protein